MDVVRVSQRSPQAGGATGRSVRREVRGPGASGEGLVVLVAGGGAKREIERSSGSGSAVVVCGEGLDGPGGVAMVGGATCGR